MNGKDIFMGLRYVGDDLVEEAEFGKFPKRTAKTTYKRTFLAAALIAMMLLLTGCAAVYVLSMRDLMLGEVEMTDRVYETDVIDIGGFEEGTYQTITFAGFKGSTAYQAAQEWFAFNESYQPDPAQVQEIGRKLPEEYAWYHIRSQEMKDVLDGILAKYNLKLMGVPLEFSSTKAMCSALGIEKMLTTNNEATVRYGNGTCWESGNFSLDFDISLPENPESEATNAWGVLHWNRKEVLDPETRLITNMDEWREWNYTTASGSQVLMMRLESEGEEAAYILSDRPEGILSVIIHNRTHITDRQMEQIADALDFSIQPRKVSWEDAQNQPEAPQEATQDGYTLRLKSVETDGTEVVVTIGVIAPEGEDICHGTRKGKKFGISAETAKVTPRPDYLPELVGVGANEDGDGLDNTHDIVIRFEMGDAAPGTVWNLSLENLVNSFWWYPDAVEKVLAVGAWQFEIAIADDPSLPVPELPTE